MIRAALTGGIGTGKSTTLKMFKLLGVPVLSADKVVHSLLKTKGDAYEIVAKEFPVTKTISGIDRKKLGEIVFSNEVELKKLEAIMHPLVKKAEAEFLLHAQTNGSEIAIIEIPLLFETGGQKSFDVVIATNASAIIKWQRVKNRVNMSEEKYKAIIKRQLSDAKKCELANYVIHTGLGKAQTMRQVENILKEIYARNNT